MAFDDRLGFLILGGMIGFILGYIVRSLRDIKEELDEVDELVKDRFKNRDESGFINSTLGNVALIVVIGLTVFASIASQRAHNDSENALKQFNAAQVQLAHQTLCNRTVLKDALVALNERTTYSEAQVNTNVALQTSFSRLLGTLLNNPDLSPKQREDATNKYFQDLTNYVSIADKTKQKVRDNPFPSDEELSSCLEASEDSSE